MDDAIFNLSRKLIKAQTPCLLFVLVRTKHESPGEKKSFTAPFFPGE